MAPLHFPPLLFPLLFFPPHLFSPISSFLSSPSLSTPSSPPFLPPSLSSASHSVGSTPTAALCPQSWEPESRGQNSHPKSPLRLNIYCCVCTQKLIPRFCWVIPTAHFAFGKSGRHWPALAGHNGSAHNARTQACWLCIQNTQPGHYHSGAEIHPSVHLIGHSAALNDLSVPCPAIFCLINSFIVHRIKKDKGLPAIMIH